MRLATGIVLVAAALVAGCGQGGAGGGSEMMTRLFGAKPEALVRDMFESPDPDARRQAIEKLSSHDWGLRDPYLKGYSLKAQDENAAVRSAAIRALGKAGDTRYAPAVIVALRDRAPAVRGDAAVALDWMPSPDAVTPLMQSAAKDESLDVRMNSCRALRHYPRRDVLETLLAAMDDSDFGVRFQAAQSLKEMTGEDGGTDSAVWRDRLGKRADPFVWRKAEPRPWWDWFGVAAKPAPTPPASATQPAPAAPPAAPVIPAAPSPAPAATRPAVSAPAVMPAPAARPSPAAVPALPAPVATAPAPATKPAPEILDFRPKGMNQPPPLTPPSTLVPRESPPEPAVVDLTPKATTSTAPAAAATRPVITPDPSVSISVATHPAATVRPVLTPAQSPPMTQPAATATQPSAPTTSTAPAPQYPIILKFPPPSGKPAATQPVRWWAN